MRADQPRLRAAREALDDTANLTEELLITSEKTDLSDRIARLKQIIS